LIKITCRYTSWAYNLTYFKKSELWNSLILSIMFNADVFVNEADVLLEFLEKLGVNIKVLLFLINASIVCIYWRRQPDRPHIINIISICVLVGASLINTRRGWYLGSRSFPLTYWKLSSSLPNIRNVLNSKLLIWIWWILRSQSGLIPCSYARLLLRLLLAVSITRLHYDIKY